MSLKTLFRDIVSVAARKIRSGSNLLLIKIFDFFCLNTNLIRVKETYDLAIVRMDRIGDFVLALAPLNAILDKYKGRRVLYVCGKYTGDLAKDSGLFTDVLVLDKIEDRLFWRRLFYHIKFVSAINCISASTVINTMWSRLYPSDYVVKYIKSKNKIGCDGNQRLTPHDCTYNNVYSKLISGNTFESEILNNQFFVNSFCDSSYKASLSRLSFVHPTKYVIEGQYVMVAFSASCYNRVWPIERMAKVIETLPDCYKIVVCGQGQDDIDRYDALISLLNCKDRIVNMINKTNMYDLIGLIANSVFLIGMDSAPVHIAAAVRVPSICIAPGAHYGRFVPYPKEIGETMYHPRTISSSDQCCFKCNYNCTRRDRLEGQALPCILEIPEKEVIVEVEKLLNEI